MIGRGKYGDCVRVSIVVERIGMREKCGRG